MMFLPHSHRQFNLHRFGENRLCYEQNQIESQTNTQGVARWLTERLGKNGEWIANRIIDVPIGVVQGLKNTWNGSETEARLGAVWTKSVDFFRDAPVMRHLFEHYDKEKLKALQFKELAHLTDHENWVRAFMDHGKDLFTEVKVSPNNTDPEGVKTVMNFANNLPVEDRRRVFIEYIDRYIPEHIQSREFGGVVADKKNTDPVERFKELQKQTEKFKHAQEALGAMLGVSKDLKNSNIRYSAAANTIAKDSLQHHYQLDAQGTPLGPKESYGLFEDYRDALRYHRLSGLPVIATSPGALKQAIPPGLLKGAMELGLVNSTTLEKMKTPAMQDLEHDKSLAIGDAMANIDAIKGQTRERLQKEGLDAAGVWKGLGGFEKLILIIAAIYGTYKRPGIALGLTALYFGRKFLFKDQDPLKTWSGWTQKGVDWVKDKNADLWEKAGYRKEDAPGMDLDPADMAARMVEFLPETDRKTMEIQATGYGLLAEVPLEIIAKNFEMGGAKGEHWTLQTGEGTTLDEYLSSKVDPRYSKGGKTGKEKNPMDPYRDFLCKNTPEISDAIGSLFYMVARNDPSRLSIEDIELVEKVRRMLPRGTSYADLCKIAQAPPAGIPPELLEMVRKADAAYVRVVARGRLLATSPSLKKKTVGEYVVGVLGMRAAAKKESKSGVSGDASKEKKPLNAESGATKPGSEVVDRRKDTVEFIEKKIADVTSLIKAAEDSARKKVAESEIIKKLAEQAKSLRDLVDATKSSVEQNVAKKNAEEAIAAHKLAEASVKLAESDVRKKNAESSVLKKELSVVEARANVEAAEKNLSSASDASKHGNTMKDADIVSSQRVLEEAKKKLSIAESGKAIAEAEYALKSAEYVALQAKELAQATKLAILQLEKKKIGLEGDATRQKDEIANIDREIAVLQKESAENEQQVKSTEEAARKAAENLNTIQKGSVK